MNKTGTALRGPLLHRESTLQGDLAVSSHRQLGLDCRGYLLSRLWRTLEPILAEEMTDTVHEAIDHEYTPDEEQEILLQVGHMLGVMPPRPA